ncbi:pyrrolo-quinoline quinone [Paraburkholderia sp. DGU8]|uniref:pyrrolo-quinoline quinone n=1 Tax=Paraburkholderia sp. DGU8 TaxID=3161997 RepID=UPI0034653885
MEAQHSRRRLYALSGLILLSAFLFADCGGGSGGDDTTASDASGGSGALSAGASSTARAAASETAGPQDVLTYHNDIARTGQALNETVLTPANVESATFGKVGFFAVDGKVDAQPLYVGAQSIAGIAHNVLYVVTEHDTVFAFDADSGATLWKRGALPPGETASDDLGCGQITKEIGVTATPVIDRTRGPNGTIYYVSMSKDTAGNYHHRVHALDLSTGAGVLGSPTEIGASYPGNGAASTNGVVPFIPALYAERAGLLLLNDVLYTTWTSHCDDGGYTGWIIGYGAGTLQQTTVLNVTPNGIRGAIWMSGAGPASDGSSIYLLDGNGTFDTTLNANGFPNMGDFGNGFLKLGTEGGLSVADYFAMANVTHEADDDIDLGSGGALVLPDLTDANGAVQHLTLGAGKDANIYVLNRDSMGKFNASGDNIYQRISGQLAGPEFGMPAYYNGRVYFGPVGDNLKAFTVSNALLSTTPSARSSMTFAFPGTTPSVSANGTTNGIVWAVENGSTAVLHAFDPVSLAELYNSNQAGTRDQFGVGNKFITPMIANGKVYVGTTNGVAVFGLLGG